MDLFTEYENKLEEERKAAELHRLKRAIQWCRARFNRSQRNNNDTRYPLYWTSLNMLQAWGKHEGVLERALNELVFQDFLTYHSSFNYYDGNRSYNHAQVYMIKNTQKAQ